MPFTFSRKKEEFETTAKETRRRKREEKRKRKALTVFRKQEEDKVSMKIAREERKLIKAQRQLESIRLLDELFDRIKVRKVSFMLHVFNFLMFLIKAFYYYIYYYYCILDKNRE